MKTTSYFLSIAVLLVGCLTSDAPLYGQQNRQQSRPAPNVRENVTIEQFKADAMKAFELVGEGNVDEAAPITEKLLKQAKEKFADETDTPLYLFNLGQAYNSVQRSKEAILCGELAAEVGERSLGKDAVDLSHILNQLGVFYAEAKDFPAAEKNLKRALEIREAKSGKDHAETIQTLANLALVFRIQNRDAESEALYNRVFDTHLAKLVKEEDEEEIGELLEGISNALEELTGIYRAQRRFVDEESLIKRLFGTVEKKFGKDHPFTDNMMNNMGTLYSYWGHFAKAESLCLRALEKMETSLGKDDINVTRPLENLSDLYREQKRTIEWIQVCERILKIHKEQLGEDHPATAEAMSRLAMAYEGQGRYIEAESLYKRALELKAADSDLGRNHPLFAASTMNLANLYRSQAGRYAEAEQIYKQSLETLKATLGEEHQFTAAMLAGQAGLYVAQGRCAEAEMLYKRVYEIFKEEFGEDSVHTMSTLGHLASLYTDQGRYAEAEPLHKRRLEFDEARYGKDQPATMGSLCALAEHFLAQKRYAEAESFFDRAFACGSQAFSSRSLLYKATNRPREAVADLKRAIDNALEERKHASGSDEQRAQTFAGYYNLFERMVDWQHELGDMNEAYEAMERSRAQGLQDLINSNNIDLLEGVPPEIAQKLRNEENAALTDVASFEKQLELQPNDEKLKESLKNARKRLVDAMAAIRSASPSYRLMIAEDRKPVALETVRKEFNATKTLALEYLIGKEKSYVLVCGPGVQPTLLPLELSEEQATLFNVDAGPLTATTLETILQNDKNNGVLQLAANPKNTIPADKLAVLWHLFVPKESIRTKILDGKSFARLLVLPDGALARFPFEMLIVEPDAVNPMYLLDKGPAVVYAPSASMYYNLNRRNTETTTAKTLTVGNPDYTIKMVKSSDTLKEMNNSRRAARMGTLDPLPWTERETAWVEESSRKNNISVTRLNLLQATEENIRKNTSGRKIVHLACHGLAEGDFGNAMFSALAVTVGDPNDPKNDGFLDLAEMFGLDLKSCELAVLSACDTNLGPNQHGEGTWSMGRGMLASGAKRVVTTNWQVADDASAYLAFQFIDTVNKANSPDYAEALRNAKRSIRGNTDTPTWQHPYYWAPFILMGTD